MKYLVVTGGGKSSMWTMRCLCVPLTPRSARHSSSAVVSGLGKGISISSLGVLLQSCGLRITAIKIDPYLVRVAQRPRPFPGACALVAPGPGALPAPPPPPAPPAPPLATELGRWHYVAL